MAADPKWQRWTKASLSRYLGQVAATVNGLALVVEGVHDRNPAFMSSAYKAEVTIGGPYVREVSKGYWRVWVTVVVIISSRTGNEQDVYRHDEIAGAFVSALAKCIDVRKYESTFVEGDPAPELVGNLRPTDKENDSVGADNIKPTDSDKVKSTVVQARLNGYFPN